VRLYSYITQDHAHLFTNTLRHVTFIRANWHKLRFKRNQRQHPKPESRQGAYPMSAGNRTKKIIIAATITTALAFSGLQAATAAPGAKGPGPNHPCIMQGQQFDEATIKARETFLSETTALRKSVAEKRAAKRAIMKSTSPDPEKASKLTGELFELREQLRAKAKAAGLPPQMMMGMGRMGDGPMMDCNCQQMHGRHHGWNNM
jgi:zinc resistance-associated protein